MGHNGLGASRPDAIWWWGYLHSNGTVQCKRWFGDKKDYTEDCQGKDFVTEIVEPFIAPDRDAAFRFILDRLMPLGKGKENASGK